MKKYILSLAIAGFSIFAFGQVGINTQSPQATFDIRGKNDTGTSGAAVPGVVDSKDGILVPRVNSLAASGSVNGQLVYLVADAGSYPKGFYYWNGSAWTQMGSGGGSSVASPSDVVEVSGLASGLGSPVAKATFDAGTFSPNNKDALNTIYVNSADGTTYTYDGSANYVTYTAPASTEWYIAGTTTDAGSSKTAKVSRTGAVAIGGSTPDASALLDVNSTSKGVLLPRLALTSNTDSSTISSPATGLLVYNTGTAGLTYIGYVFWNGSEWRSIDNSTTVAPSVASLVCNNAYINPKAYYAGQSYTGTMYVPYTGGNGAPYKAGTAFTVNGLTFTLQAGKLEYGSGNFVFSVTGTATNANAMAISLTPTQIPVLKSDNSQNCATTISSQNDADIKTAAVMGYATYIDNTMAGSYNGGMGYQMVISSPDGNYKVRVFFPGLTSTQASTNTARPQIQLLNLTGATKTLYWNYDTNYGGWVTNAGRMTGVTSGSWGGDGDGNTWGTAVGRYWGNDGIIDGANNGPEYRRYTWIDDSAATKVEYTIWVMAGTPNNGASYPANTKIYIKLEQVTAP